MSKLSFLLGVAALAAAASAQQVVIPNGMASTNPGTSGLTWRNTAFRFQMLYDESNLTLQGINYPIVISRLQFRASGGVTSPGGETYNGVTVQMSTSPNDWNTTISTTFAANRGPDNTTVFTGNIVCLPAAGSSPNTYIIDIPLATPFTYDPSSGMDLCIEVDAPVPLPATVPNMACSSNNTHLARRMSASTQSATTGSSSYFASVVMMDYAPAPNSAIASKYGAGCVKASQSFYEVLAAGSFDLGGSAGAPNSLLLSPNAAGGYDVTPGTNGWFTPTSANLGLTDDSLSAAQPLGFTFNYPGGSTTGIKICSNGFVWLDATQTLSTYSGTPTLLLTQGARIAALWNDMDPTTLGTIHFDVDPSGVAAYATWDQVPVYGTTTSLNTFQVALFQSGAIELRYQACLNDPGIFGWSPGGNAQDPGSMDVSASVPFSTRPDLRPLALEPTNRPKLGATQNLDMRDIPANAIVAGILLGFTQNSAGVSLAPLGAPSCFQFASADATAVFLVNTSSQLFQLPIPNVVSIAGLHVYAQAVSGAPGTNALNAITSNGVDLLLDIN